MKLIVAVLLLLSSILSFGQEKLVKVNGTNFNVYEKGFENRKKNTPVIIFENGLGAGLGNPISVQEDNYVTNRIEREFKTNPKVNPQFFWTVSPFAQSDTEHRTLKTLLTIPIRIYNEPDIGWYIDNRNIDFYCINSLDSSAMINWLRFLGNKKAELVITSGKGYRISSNKRHPHSWTIADGQGLVDWITKTTSN